MSRGEVRKEG